MEKKIVCCLATMIGLLTIQNHTEDNLVYKASICFNMLVGYYAMFTLGREDNTFQARLAEERRAQTLEIV